MQMLNFVKIPKMLLLLQLISINTQLNYPNTVQTITPNVSPRKPTSSSVTKAETIVTIVAKLGLIRLKDENGDFQFGKFFAKLDSGEYYLTDQCCDVFKEPAQSSVEKNWEEYKCSDVNIEIVKNYTNAVDIRIVTNLKFTYIGIEKFNNWTISEKFWKNIENETFLQVYHENKFRSIEINVTVQTITPNVSWNKQYTSPVTNAKTVVILKVESVYSGTFDSVIDRWFPTVAKPDARLKSQEACSLFKPSLQGIVPVNFQQSKCSDAYSKTYFDNGNTTTKVNISSNFRFTYTNLVNLNVDKMTRLLTNLFSEAVFKNSMEFKNLTVVKFSVSVKINTLVVLSRRPNGETIVIIEVSSYYSLTIESFADLYNKWFYIYGESGKRRKFREACLLFEPLLKEIIPDHYQKSEFSDVYSKPYFYNGNTAAKVNITSYCQFSHPAFEDFDIVKMRKLLTPLFEKADFNKILEFNNLTVVKFSVSIRRKFPSAAIHY